MELVTGRAGTPHITSQQDRQRNQGTFGDGAYILKTGNQLAPVVQSSNKIQIKDGALMFQGALFSVKVGTVDEVTIANGSQGMQRKDLIVARYTYDAGENVESAAWAVIQGTPAASNPVTPEYTEGDIQAGDTTVECPVFIVTLDGINITGVEMVPEIAPDVPEIMAQLEELNSNLQIETGSVSSVDKGTIRYIKNGNVVYVYGFLTINDSIGAVDILPYRAKRAARFPAAGYFNVDSNVASYGHGRVETDNGKVSIWLDSAATYAAINFVYETTGERTTNPISQSNERK